MEFENSRPKLVPGTLLKDGQKIIYETKDGQNQIVLPVHFERIISLIDGTRSLKEIAHEIFSKEGKVPFKDLFSCMEQLNSHGIVENVKFNKPETGKTQNIYEKESSFLGRSFFQVKLLKRILVDHDLLAGYLFLSFLLIFSGILFLGRSWQISFPNQFLRLDGSYLKGLLFLFVVNSLFISFKNIVKLLLLIMATGRVYNISLRLNLFSLALKVDDSSIYHTHYRWHGLIYCFACISSYFVFANIIDSFLDRKILVDQITIIAMILTLVDLDPFRKSDVSRLFNIFYESENMGHLLPYLQKKALSVVSKTGGGMKKEILFSFYSALAILWLFTIFNLTFRLLDGALPNLISATQGIDLLEKVSAIIILVALCLVILMVSFDIGKVFVSNVFYPFRRYYYKAVSRKIESDDIDRNEVYRSLQEMSIFSNLSQEYLNELTLGSKVFKIQKSRNIIVQGEDGECAYVLLKGSVEVLNHLPSGAIEQVAILKTPSIFGEMALLDKSRRGADVKSLEEVLVLEIKKDAFDKMTSQVGHKELLERIQINQFLSSSEVFRNLPNIVVQLFTDKGIKEAYKAGDIIFKQGDKENGFYLLYRGSVDVLREGKSIAIIGQGGFFGEMALLLNATRSGTIKAIEDVKVLRIPSHIFWKVLLENINLAIFVESVAGLREKVDELKAEI